MLLLILMLPYLLIVGLAYGIAYWISSTGLAYWRATLGFTVAFVAAWLGGTLIGALLYSQLAPDGVSQRIEIMLGTGFWLASIGAGFGVYRARFKLRTGESAPAFKFPSWVLPVVGGVTVVGILAAVALPALQGKSKVQIAESKKLPEFDLSQFQTPQAKPSRIDDLLPAPDSIAPGSDPLGLYRDPLGLYQQPPAQPVPTPQGNFFNEPPADTTVSQTTPRETLPELDLSQFQKKLGPFDRWRYESCQKEAAQAPTPQGVGVGLRICREKFGQ